MNRILIIAAMFVLLAGPALADNNPNKPSPAPSIEKKDLDRAQTKFDKAVLSGNPDRINRTAADLAEAQARCGTPCN